MTLVNDYFEYFLCLNSNALEKNINLLLWNKRSFGRINDQPASIKQKLEEAKRLYYQESDSKSFLSLTTSIMEQAVAVGVSTDIEADSKGQHFPDAFKTCFTILIISKSAFAHDQETGDSGKDVFEDLLANVKSEKLEPIALNDIYLRFILNSDTSGSSSSSYMLYWVVGCTPIHLKKYVKSALKMVSESPAQFKSITLPYLESLDPGRTSWIREIIAGRAEMEGRVYSDNDPESGFQIVPDSKWDGKTANSLYLLLIVNNGSRLRCIRDLNETHIPLLKNMLARISECVPAKYPFVKADQLRIYLHYLPSYFHLHAHIVHVDYQGLKGMQVGQAHLLQDVLGNLEIDPAYYGKRTLHFNIGEEHDLYEKLTRK